MAIFILFSLILSLFLQICESKKPPIKLLQDQLRVTKESHLLDIKLIHEELDAIKNRLEELSITINDTEDTGVDFSKSVGQSQLGHIQEVINKMYADDSKYLVEYSAILRKGFKSLKVWNAKKVQDLENLLLMFEKKSTEERRELMTRLNDTRVEILANSNLTINKVQTDIDHSFAKLREQVRMMQNSTDSCQAEIRKSEEMIDSKLNTIQNDVSRLKERIPRYSVMNDEWLVVFQAGSGGFIDVYAAWRSAKIPHWSSPRDFHDFSLHKLPYRHDAVDQWNSLGVLYVRLAHFYSDGEQAAFLLFDGIGSDNMNWFSKDRLLDFSWGQLRYDSAVNYFSVSGDEVDGRRFFINVRYEGCQNDHGFLLVLSPRSPRPCDYEKSLGRTTEFLHSEFPGGTRWSSNKFGLTSHMVISIQTKN